MIDRKTKKQIINKRDLFAHLLVFMAMGWFMVLDRYNAPQAQYDLALFVLFAGFSYLIYSVIAKDDND